MSKKSIKANNNDCSECKITLKLHIVKNFVSNYIFNKYNESFVFLEKCVYLNWYTLGGIAQW